MSQAIELVIDLSEVSAGIQEVGERVVEALWQRTQLLNHIFAERVRRNLSGEVLQTRSGALLGTVAEQGPSVTDSGITASVTAGGEAAPYGIVHEHGGEKWYMIYPVNKRALAFEMNGKMVFAASVHHPPLPKRSWFGSVEEEMRDGWGAELQNAIGEALA